jgi:hypothetical protein
MARITIEATQNEVAEALGFDTFGMDIKVILTDVPAPTPQNPCYLPTQRLQAIRAVREVSGMTLLQSKLAVELMEGMLAGRIPNQAVEALTKGDFKVINL